MEATLTGWTLFFVIVGVTACAAQFLRLVDWIGGHR